jgi:uncharacterized protein
MHRRRRRDRPRPPAARPVRPRAARRAVWAVRGVAGLLVLGVAAVIGIGWYFSGVAVAVGSHAFDPVATVRAVAPDATAVELSSSGATTGQEQTGLEWDGGYGRLGGVLHRTPTTVTRSFTPLVGTPAPGEPVGVDPNSYPGDPRTALGLDFSEPTLHSDVGALPAWYVPGALVGGTWAVFVHGHDGSRREALRYLPLLHERGMPVLVPTYRNDVGAPRSPDGLDHLGDTEWRDVEPAVRWALDHGARDVVLFGWSMGGAVSLQLVDRSPLRDAVRGLVLDSPVLSWSDVLLHQGRLRGLPDPVTGVAQWFVERRLGSGLDRFDWAARAAELRRPMLVIHSDADGYVPDGPSKAVARARPDLVTYLDVPGAGHTRGWNIDPRRYRAEMQAWLTGLGA